MHQKRWKHRLDCYLKTEWEMQQHLKWQVLITLIFFERQNAYICLFTCAVHLELVTSLSTEEFLKAFRRFIACRGRSTVVYNGKNFVGAKNLLQKINWRKISQYCVLNEITWHCNLPSAAWGWRKWWELLIHLLKDLLKKTLKRTWLSWTKKWTLFYVTA